LIAFGRSFHVPGERTGNDIDIGPDLVEIYQAESS
jgi:hypothetical protein